MIKNNRYILAIKKNKFNEKQWINAISQHKNLNFMGFK